MILRLVFEDILLNFYLKVLFIRTLTLFQINPNPLDKKTFSGIKTILRNLVGSTDNLEKNSIPARREQRWYS